MVETTTNVATFDVWTIPHAALGVIAAYKGVPVLSALWVALAIEAVEVALSNTYPGLARESRSNQLGDLAAFAAGYSIGDNSK